MSVWQWLVNPVGLTPHGYCLTWAPGLIWLHALSDIIIGLAYLSIPLAMAWFVRKRKDFPYRWMLLLFVGFIVACGLTHFMSVYTLWVAAYGVEGLLKAITAIVSVATAVALWPLLPRLLALPSPSQMAALNASLSRTVAEQDRTAHMLVRSEDRVRRANAELERRVSERTAELSSANARLQATLADLSDVRVALERTVEERTQALKQRDLLLREVYHRVKNNLQIVDSLIVMQGASIDNASDKAFLHSLHNRVYTLGLVHQQLMTSEDMQTFDLAPFLTELTENIVAAEAHGKIRLEVEAVPLPVTLDYAVPLGLIVTELVTNSLKYGFPDGEGTLSVGVAIAGEQVVVTVSDDGPGVGDVTKGTGIGTRLIAGLVRQLGGSIDVATSCGTSSRVTLPKPQTT